MLLVDIYTWLCVFYIGRVVVEMSAQEVTGNFCQGILVASDASALLELTSTIIADSKAPDGLFLADVWALEKGASIGDATLFLAQTRCRQAKLL
jgi:hypothetical protein